MLLIILVMQGQLLLVVWHRMALVVDILMIKKMMVGT
jgi:hypothetical protein